MQEKRKKKPNLGEKKWMRKQRKTIGNEKKGWRGLVCWMLKKTKQENEEQEYHNNQATKTPLLFYPATACSQIISLFISKLF